MGEKKFRGLAATRLVGASGIICSESPPKTPTPYFITA
jgi:hypothetical protein